MDGKISEQRVYCKIRAQLEFPPTEIHADLQRAPATRGLRNWWLPSPLWHMGGKSPQKQRRPIIIEQN